MGRNNFGPPPEPATTEQIDDFFSQYCDPYKISLLEARHSVTGHPRSTLSYLVALSSAGRRFQEFQLTDLSNWLHGFAEESSKLCKLSLSGSHYVAAQLCQIALLKVQQQDWFGSKGERSKAFFSKGKRGTEFIALDGSIRDSNSLVSTNATAASPLESEATSSDMLGSDSDDYDERYNVWAQGGPPEGGDTATLEELIPLVNAWIRKVDLWRQDEGAREKRVEWSDPFREIVVDVVMNVAHLVEKVLMPCASEISKETSEAWETHNKNYADKGSDYALSSINHIGPSHFMDRASCMDLVTISLESNEGLDEDMTQSFNGSFWWKAILWEQLNFKQCLEILTCMVIGRTCHLVKKITSEEDGPFADYTYHVFPAADTMALVVTSQLYELRHVTSEWRETMESDDSGVCAPIETTPAPTPDHSAFEEDIRRALNTIMPEAEQLQLAEDFKRSLIRDISEILGTEAKPFGSFHTGFMSNSSDLDLMVPLTDESKTRLELWGREAAVVGASERQAAAAAACHFLSSSLSRKHSDIILKPVAGANVPVLKVKKVASADAVVSVDITFDNWLGVYNSDLLKAYAETDPRVRFLGILVKYWAKRRGLDNVLEGGLAPYAWVLMVIFFCQMREPAPLLPNLQRFPSNTTAPNVRPIHDSTFYNPPLLPKVPPPSAFVEVLPGWPCACARKCMLKSGSSPKVLLTDLIKEFFDFYATKFNWFYKVIAIRHTPGVISKLEMLKSGSAKSGGAKKKGFLRMRNGAEDSGENTVPDSSASPRLEPKQVIKPWPYIGSSHQMKSMPFMVVEDPFEQCRLLFPKRKSRAHAIARELIRACYLLSKEESFIDVVCENDP